MQRILKILDDEGRLPEKYKKFVGMKKFPTVRSVVAAPEGQMVVEADYQTAEMVVLAYKANDDKMLQAVTGKDPCFGIPKPEAVPANVDPADCVVRLAWPDYVTLPEDKDKFLMTYAADGEIKARFTMDDLKRDDNGELLHPKMDAHWRVVEISRHEARENLNKKKDRGAGKTTNFCVVGSTKVLTQDGLISIKDLSNDSLLWDGHNWITHGGVVCRGIKLVIQYDGITGTPDHAVFTDQGKLALIDARIRRAKIIQAADEDRCIRVTDTPVAFGYDLRNRQREIQTVCSDLLQALRKHRRKKPRKHIQRTQSKLSHMSYISKVRWCAGTGDQDSRAALRLHGTTLHVEDAQAVERLSGQRDQGGVHIERGLHHVGPCCIPGTDVQGVGVRPDRQRRKLLQDELTACTLIAEPYQQERSHAICCGRVYTKPSRRRLFIRDRARLNSSWSNSGRDSRTAQKGTSNVETEAEILESAVQEYVYDVIDAGPFNRFTANGKLISNSSSYGGNPPSIARKIEQDTGHNPGVEAVEGLLDAIRIGAPEADKYMKAQEEIPRKASFIRASSGRIRHLHTLSNDVQGLSTRTREGALSALGRECRNFP